MEHPKTLEIPKKPVYARQFAEEAFEALAVYGSIAETRDSDRTVLYYYATARFDVEMENGLYAFRLLTHIQGAAEEITDDNKSKRRLVGQANDFYERYRAVSLEFCELGSEGWHTEAQDAELNWQRYVTAEIDFAKLDEVTLVNGENGIELTKKDARKALEILRLVRSEMATTCLEDAVNNRGIGYAAGLGPVAITAFGLRLVNPA